MAGSINVALQGLSVAMRGFETTSNNIANVNTPGYSRQQIELSSRAAPENGVQIINIGRVVDIFATQQHWSSSASFKSTESYAFFAGQVDDLLANPNTSLSAATDQFFSALQTGVDDPSSVPNRELILAQTESLVRRFTEVDRQLRAQNDAVNSKLHSTVDEVNDQAAQVAKLNDLIRLSAARGESANELKDQRDQLILSISEKIGGTVQTSTGSTDINIYIGNGAPLVIGGNASQLISRQGDPDINDIDVFVEVNGRATNVSDQVREGEVGGMLDFKDDVLLPSWNELGRLAIVMADTLNSQHSKGIDLDGNLAGNMFKDPLNVGEVKAFSSNQGDLDSLSSVVIRDSSQLQASDYEVKFGESGKFVVIRTVDNAVFTQDDFESQAADWSSDYQESSNGQVGTVWQDVTGGQMRLNLDGIDITLSTENGQAFIDTDRILVQPVRFGAELMELEISSGRELAFAAPIRAEFADNNGGTLSVGTITVNDLPQDRTNRLLTVDLSSVVPPIPDAMVYFHDNDTYSVFEKPSSGVFDPATATPHVFDGINPSVVNAAYDPAVGIDIPVGVDALAATVNLQLSENDISDSINVDVGKIRNQPLQLVFDGSGAATTFSVYDMSDPSNPVILSSNHAYTESEPIQLHGFEITVKGKPEAGDKIDLSFNSDGVGDNRNALKLSRMQQQSLVDGSSYQDNYGRLVERIGTKTSLSMINLEATQAIMMNAESVRSGISGVNLDEEAANLIKFQQQYQAASQVINTARSLFESLLSSVG